MIKYALLCDDCDHGFEAWFASSAAFAAQKDRDLVECPACGSASVEKQIMAPSLKGTRKREEMSPETMARRFVSAARKHISETCDYVGDKFASEARSMHHGETDERPIWGQVTPEERVALEDEGVPAQPLPAPLVPKQPTEPEKLN